MGSYTWQECRRVPPVNICVISMSNKRPRLNWVGMAVGFSFRCPNTRLIVQGWIADDPTDDDAFEPITCTACTRVHLVNPATGKVLGEDDD